MAIKELDYVRFNLYIKRKYGSPENFIEATGCKISAGYLRQLMFKRQKNITLDKVAELARCLNVPMGSLAEEVYEWTKS